MIGHIKYPEERKGQKYDINQEIDFRIEAPSNHYVIQVNVSEFDIESEKRCSYDYVQIFDGGDADDESQLLSPGRGSRFCSFRNKELEDFVSRRSSVLIRFYSDEYDEGDGTGFVLRYKMLEREPGMVLCWLESCLKIYRNKIRKRHFFLE